MNSNKFFSFSRFYLLLRNDMLLNRQKYHLVVSGAFIFVFVFLYMQMPKIEQLDNTHWIFDGRRYLYVFVMGLFVLGGFITTAFSDLSNKVKTSNYLLIPASTFEKFLSQFFIKIVIGTAIFLFVFWVDAHLARAVALSQMQGPNHEPATANAANGIAKFHYSMFLIKDQYPTVTYWKFAEGLAMIMGIFSIGLYLFSSKLFFKKKGSIKSPILLIVGFYIVINLMVMFLYNNYSYLFTKVAADNIEYKLQNGYTNIEILKFSIAYFAPLFLIPLGYFKLKEKQL